MSIITYALLLVFYGLIKLGEGIVWIVKIFFSILLGRKIETASTRKKDTFHLVGRKKRYKRTFGKVLDKVFSVAGTILLSPILIPKTISASLVGSRKKKTVRKKVKKSAYKPAFLYKFKYLTIGALLSSILLFVPGIFLIFLSDLPNPNRLSQDFIPKTTKIYDRNNTLLYEIYVNQNRTLVTLDRIPAYLQQATISIEDKNFYKRIGSDIGRVCVFSRASPCPKHLFSLWPNSSIGKKEAKGST